MCTIFLVVYLIAFLPDRFVSFSFASRKSFLSFSPCRGIFEKLGNLTNVWLESWAILWLGLWLIPRLQIRPRVWSLHTVGAKWVLLIFSPHIVFKRGCSVLYPFLNGCASLNEWLCVTEWMVVRHWIKLTLLLSGHNTMWKSLAFTQDPKSTPQEIFSSIGVLLTETPLGLLLTETPDCPASQSLNYNARCFAVAVFLGSASVPILSLSFLNWICIPWFCFIPFCYISPSLN